MLQIKYVIIFLQVSAGKSGDGVILRHIQVLLCVLSKIYQIKVLIK